jgi:hypothetical protein
MRFALVVGGNELHCLQQLAQFVISLADRVVNVAGITTRPDEAWMLQMARNLTDWKGGALHAKQYLTIDRDTKYSEQFRRMIRDNCVFRRS